MLPDDRARELLERGSGDVELGARAHGDVAEREIGRLEPEPQRVELGIDPHPDLKDRIFRLRVVDDAVEFLK